MPISDNLAPPQSAPPYEQGFQFLHTFEAGDAIYVVPALRVSGGRVSFAWTLTVGAGASIVREVSMVWPEPVWVKPLDPALEPEAPIVRDYVDGQSFPFGAMRLTQTGGDGSTLAIMSRFPLVVGNELYVLEETLR